MDHYTNVAFVPKIIETLQKDMGIVQMKSGDTYGEFQFFKYPEDRRGNPHVRRPRNSRTLVQIRDIMAQNEENKTGTHSKVFNYAGLSYPPDDSMMGKRCHHPFRQIVVHHDGNIPLCCNSWNSPYNVGNIHDVSLEEIWQSNAFGAAREKLYHGQRDFTPCKGCNHRSYRVGLLPDLLGKGTLRKPDLFCRLRRIKRQASGGGALTDHTQATMDDMMIISLRGTSGAGKSHLVRRIMELYPNAHPEFVEFRAKPLYTVHSGAVAILGHYENSETAVWIVLSGVWAMLMRWRSDPLYAVSCTDGGQNMSDRREAGDGADGERDHDIHVVHIDTPVDRASSQCAAVVTVSQNRAIIRTHRKVLNDLLFFRKYKVKCVSGQS